MHCLRDKFSSMILGGDETRSGYMRYIQGIQPNIPACTTCRHGLNNSMVCALNNAINIFGSIERLFLFLLCNDLNSN